MKEYIKRAAILQAIEESEPDVMADYGEYYGSEWGFSRSKLSEIIRGMPAADVVDVRHGSWEKFSTASGIVSRVRCSVCAGTQPLTFESMPYCPNCGARMDKEADHV